ncbi:MAG: gliding motility protein GldM [Bacteroidia bacterium]|nr:gliding motility protein GldM [Bacteroidia bacterium]
MGHGKETPRQKMIGMMYLVYTSMLAMNVSADLLNAFVLVDSGLSQTTHNYATKNAQTYAEFTQAEMLNPGKVKPWREKAEAVHTQSQELYSFIKDLKYNLVKTSDGEKSPALMPNGDVDGMLVETKTNTDVPGLVLIEQGNGAELRKKVASYRDAILNLIDKERDSALYGTINEMLNTDDPPATNDGIQHTWESYRFEHIPLVAVLPQLTKVQVDVLNAEADVMSYLMSRIDAGDFKFNRLEAVVIPSSDYVMRGETFSAQVFMAASDTTQRPTIYIGAYDSVRNEKTGEWNYSMRGGYDTVPVSDGGRGMYRRVAASTGRVSWGGLVEFAGPQGDKIRLPFKHSYTVSEASVAVSPTKMNVFYLGVDNPVDISASGGPLDQIKVSVSDGTITRSGNGYLAKVTGRPGAVVKVTVSAGGKVMGVKDFRVKKVPDPLPSLFGVSPDAMTLRKSQLTSSQGVVAAMPEDFDFDMKFTVLGFTVGAVVGGYLTEQVSTGPQFTDRQKQLMQNLTAGMQLTITNIRVKGPDGVVRTLQPKVYKIQ